ncbi:hypothetical protein [Paenibacillus amylolyticus]|uniref:hypothetical protein n=1 Tax=Paenibacillus amylolyticus TaxID=1451 RepID=UPI00201E1C84|nr:hypothetical protein [Paenibacillus amylolyticus]MCL6664549.1 hypothetical protein [Paenibacillus amylolyticus]
MKRVGLRFYGQKQRELEYFERKYNVSAARVVMLAYQLSDRLLLERMLEIQKGGDQDESNDD